MLACGGDKLAVSPLIKQLCANCLSSSRRVSGFAVEQTSKLKTIIALSGLSDASDVVLNGDSTIEFRPAAGLVQGMDASVTETSENHFADQQ